MSRQLHAQPILDRIAASPGTKALVVHDADVPDTGEPGSEPPYVVVRFTFRKLSASDSPGTSPLALDSVTYQVDVRAACVAADARSIRGVATRVEAQLLNWRPTITGRNCTRCEQIESVDLEPNEQMGVKIAQVIDTYRFLSQPA